MDGVEAGADSGKYWAERALLWTRRELDFSRLRGMLLWAGLVGFLGAVVVAGFRETLGFLELLLTGYGHEEELTRVASQLSPLRRLLTPTLGGLLAGLVLQYGARLTSRHRSTTDYMEAFIVGDGHIGGRASLVKSVSSLFSICSGGSMGREGAMVQLSAMVGSKVSRAFRFPPSTRRTLVACGAAAGLASAYNAPLAATVFVAEIVAGSIEFEIVAPIVVSAVIANATTQDLLGYHLVFRMPDVGLVSHWELWLYLLLGVVAGYLAPLYLFILKSSSRAFARLPLPIYARFGLGGLGLGIITQASPLVWGNGHGVVSSILNESWTVPALLAVLLLKIAATSMTVGSGAVGGVFTPTLLVGAALGGALGVEAHRAFPGMIGSQAAYAVAGMGALLAATTRAPLMAILMVFEMTQDYAMVLPLMLACITANFVAVPFRVSMYGEALKRNKDQPASFSLLGQLLPANLTVDAKDSLSQVRDKIMMTPYNHLHVLDDEGRWLGVVGRETLEGAGDGAQAGHLVRADSRYLESGMTLEEAVQAAAHIPSEMMPVLESGSRKLLGTLAKSDLLLHLQRAWRGA